MSNTWPHHYRDEGGWCHWSGVAHARDGACPYGCSGSLEHYATDGHVDCDDDTTGVWIDRARS